MKRFGIGALSALSVFVLANMFSAFCLSYQLNHEEGVDRIGFPFCMHDMAGYFIPAAFWNDIAVGFLGSAAVGAIYCSLYLHPNSRRVLGVAIGLAGMAAILLIVIRFLPRGGC